MSTSHGTRVRALYKALLKLHKGLPQQLQAIGDSYVKQEFKLHKNITQAEGREFMEEWTKYYLTIAKQLSQKKGRQSIGIDMSPGLLDCLSDEQTLQLHELMKETQKQNVDNENEEQAES